MIKKNSQTKPLFTVLTWSCHFYIYKPRAQFCKLFRHKSPAKLPVEVRHGYSHCSCKQEASNRRRYIWALPLCVQNWGWRSRQSCLWLYCFPVPKRNRCTLRHLISMQDPRLQAAVLPALSSHSSACQRCGMSCRCKVDIWGRVWWTGKLYKSNSEGTLTCRALQPCQRQGMSPLRQVLPFCPAPLGEALETACSLRNHRRHQRLVGIRSQVNFHVWSITGLPKTPSLHKDIVFLAAQKLVGVQKKLNPLFETSLQKVVGLDEDRNLSHFWQVMVLSQISGPVSCISV